MADTKFVFNPITGELDIVRVFNITDDLLFQQTFNSTWNQFDNWILSNTAINASNRIELAPA